MRLLGSIDSLSGSAENATDLRGTFDVLITGGERILSTLLHMSSVHFQMGINTGTPLFTTLTPPRKLTKSGINFPRAAEITRENMLDLMNSGVF